VQKFLTAQGLVVAVARSYTLHVFLQAQAPAMQRTLLPLAQSRAAAHLPV
jgi:hypothetical protein